MSIGLDEDRLTRMRSTVLAAVDDDTRTRGRRLRRRLATGTAAAAVLVVGTVGAALVTAPGGDSGDDLASTISTDAGSYGSLSDLTERDAAADTAAQVAPEDGGITGEVTDLSDREVVVTGSANVRVDDPRDVAARLAAWVESHGGRVDAREVHDDGDTDHAMLTVRVPSAEVTATLDHLESYGDVTGVSVSNDDVTTTSRDLDARIKALGISIDRLEKILADADSSAEVVNAEQALTQRQEQLEQLTSQRSQLSEQVSLATLTVELSASASAESVDPGGFTGGLKDGWNSLVSVVNDGVQALGAAVPWLGALLVLYVLYRGGRAVARRRR